jgi:hypothetical protein
MSPFLDFGIVEAKAKDLAEFQSYVPSNFLVKRTKDLIWMDH